MIKQIVCALLVAGFLLLPSHWMKVEATENATPMSSSSEKDNVYVRTVVPLNNDEVKTYNDLATKSPALANLNAGAPVAGLDSDLLVALGCIILIFIIVSAIQAQEEANKEANKLNNP